MAAKKQLFLTFALLSSAALLSGIQSGAKVGNLIGESALVVSTLNPVQTAGNMADVDWEKETKAEIGAGVAPATVVDRAKNEVSNPYPLASAYADFKVGTKDLGQILGYYPFNWPVDD